MTRREKHSVLRKIASRRWRQARTDAWPAWTGSPAKQSRAADHLARGPAQIGDRILTRREREVLSRVARGETDQQIADKLFLSRKTVSNHVSNILGKLEVANRKDAVVAAFRIGIL